MSEDTTTPADHAASAARYPLLPPARVMLDGYLNASNSGAYLQGQLVFYQGADLRFDHLVAAAQLMTEEAEALRMYAERGEDGEWSVIECPPDPQVNTAQYDFSSKPDPDEAVREFSRAALRAGRTITDPAPQVSNYCFHLGEDRAALLSICHHVFVDGYGGLLARTRVGELLAAWQKGEPSPPRSFGRFADLVAESEEPDPAGIEFWAQMLDGAPTAVSMASRTAQPAPLYEELDLYNETFLGDLRAFDENIKWPHFAAAACIAYTSAIVDDTDVVTGFPVANRTSMQEKITPAQAMASLPLRVEADPDAAFTECAATVRAAISATRPYQRQPAEKIRAAVPQAFRTGRLYGPTVNIIPFFAPGDAGTLRTEAEVIGQGPVDDLMFVVEPWESAGIRIKLLFNPALYDAATRALHAERFDGWVRQIQAAPTTALRELECLTSEERRRHDELAHATADEGGRAELADTWGELVGPGDYAAAAGVEATELRGLSVRTRLGRPAPFGRSGQVIVLTSAGEVATGFRAEVTATGLRTRGREDERSVVAGNWVELGELRRALSPLADRLEFDPSDITFAPTSRRIAVTLPETADDAAREAAKAALDEATGSPVRVR